jgi:DNA-directed RNA polymerase specialized sigma24 family protein
MQKPTLYSRVRGSRFCVECFLYIGRQRKLHRQRHEELHHFDLNEEVPGMAESVDVAQRLERLRGDQMRTPDEVAAMLRLQALGWGERRIAGEMGCNRRTVRRGPAHLETSNWNRV